MSIGCVYGFFRHAQEWLLTAVAGQSARATTVVVIRLTWPTVICDASSSGLAGANPYGSGSMVVGPATPRLGIGSGNLATATAQRVGTGPRSWVTPATP